MSDPASPNLAAMEAILARLMMPDSTAIQEATVQLNQAIKRPEAVEALLVLATSLTPTAQISQYAALLLRKKWAPARAWAKLSPVQRSGVKQACLQALAQPDPRPTTAAASSTSSHPVKLSLAQLIAVLARHEMAGQTWPELTQFLQAHVASPSDPAARQMGLYLVAVLSESAGAQMKVLFTSPAFLKVFQRAMQEDTLEVSFYAVRGVTHLVRHIGTDELNVFRPLVGPSIDLVRKLVPVDEDKALEAMEIFEELFMSEVAIVVPFIKPIIELCMSIASEVKLEDPIRVKAISFLGQLTRLKKKTILKHKLYVQMIAILFPIMSHVSDSDESEEEEDEAARATECNTPSMVACQSLDLLAINLPPEKYMPAILAHVKPALESNDPARMKGAYNALAVSAEGCSEHIKSKYLVSFLQALGTGIKHEHPAVRNAALYALGQFSDFLQPDVSNYANDIIPVLMQNLDMLCSEMQKRHAQDQVTTPVGLDRIFYAMEIFCENLEEKLVPFLPELMQRLLVMLSGEEYTERVKELSISAIGAAAGAAQAAIVPYFDGIMLHLKKYLTYDEDEDTQILLTQSMSTLGLLARAVGPTNFAPSLAEECCKLGLDLVSKHDDPDVRKVAYSLFAAVAFVVKGEMAAVLPQIIELMLRSLRSTEGISIELKEDEKLADVTVSDDEEDGDGSISIDTKDSGQDSDEVKNIKVENSYMEEKEQALEALREICKHTGSVFLAYLEECLAEASKLLDYPEDDIRQSAICTVTELTITLHKNRSGNASFVEANNVLVADLVLKLCEVVRRDLEIMLVGACLEQLTYLLKQLSSAVTQVAEMPTKIAECVNLIMTSKCACQDIDEETAEDEDFDEAEQDEALFEHAGEIMPSLGNAMTPETFVPLLAGTFAHLVKKTKPQSTVAERSFAVGVLAECMKPARGKIQPFMDKLVPIFLRLIKDDDEDVRNNAVFGIGEMALHGGEPAHKYFPEILNALSYIFAHEQHPRVMDQAVGAACRLVRANRTIVPLQQLLTGVFQKLPLKEDMDEYDVVFECFWELFSAGEVMIKEHMSQILMLAVGVAGIDTTKEDANLDKSAMVRLVRGFYKDFQEDFNQAVGQFPPPAAETLAQIVA